MRSRDGAEHRRLAAGVDEEELLARRARRRAGRRAPPGRPSRRCRAGRGSRCRARRPPPRSPTPGRRHRRGGRAGRAGRRPAARRPARRRRGTGRRSTLRRRTKVGPAAVSSAVEVELGRPLGEVRLGRPRARCGGAGAAQLRDARAQGADGGRPGVDHARRVPNTCSLGNGAGAVRSAGQAGGRTAAKVASSRAGGNRRGGAPGDVPVGLSPRVASGGARVAVAKRVALRWLLARSARARWPVAEGRVRRRARWVAALGTGSPGAAGR